MTPISLTAVASAFPERIVPNSFFGDEDHRPGGGMFRGSRHRHHLVPGETALSLIAQAARRLEADTGQSIADGLDIILTNVSLPDLPFTGCGAEVARELGARPQWVFDLHNHGCVSFIAMLALAQSLMTTTGARRALLCNAQTAAGRIFADPGVRRLPQACVPGDGCGVALIESGDARPIEHIGVRNYPAWASDMQIASSEGADWWQPRQEQFHIDFSRAKVAKVVGRGNRIVPEVVGDTLRHAGLGPDDVSLLVTNQPNPIFLRNWREALQVPAERHLDTFAEHGNLFGAGIPVCLDRAVQQGRLSDGDNVVLGGFSHAGDYAAAAVVRWRSAA